MAYAQTAHHATTAGVSSLTTRVAALGERYKLHRMYRRTIRELSELSGRELSDLGLSSSSLQSAAYQAVYGVQR